MSATELQNQGRQAHRRGDYEKALGFFNRALGRQQTVQLYDNRAATYEKLNDFKKALQDAKGAIRTSDVDPTGYLRAGKVLVKMEKPKAALDIYAYGLRHVKHVGQGYEQLKKLHDDLLAELAPAHSVDPLTVLPRELAISVLEYCTFRQRTAICRVSKGWQSFIRSEPNLWTHLDLGAARTKKIKTSFVSVAINAAKKKLTVATLSNLYDFDKVLHALLRHCPLEVLTLAKTGLQGRNLLDVLEKVKDRLILKELRILSGTEISQMALRGAAASCQNTLEVLHCSSLSSINLKDWSDVAFPKLKSLSITADQFTLVATGLPKMLTGCPQLTSLTLIRPVNIHDRRQADFEMFDLREAHLEHVHLRQQLYSGNVHLPAAVKTLRLVLIGPSRGSFFPDDVFNERSLQLRELPVLEEVYFDLLGTPLDHMLSQFAMVFSEHPSDYGAPLLSKLRSLSIRAAMFADATCVVIPPRLEELQSLSLLDMYELQDEHIVDTVKQLPKLRSLDVSGSGITGAGVGDLLKLGQLTHMVLNDCQKISHRDAIDRARAAGVMVEYRMNDGMGGRKTRY